MCWDIEFGRTLNQGEKGFWWKPKWQSWRNTIVKDILGKGKPWTWSKMLQPHNESEKFEKGR